MNGRICTKCRQWKPASEFHKHLDKLRPRCKACRTPEGKEYFRSHRAQSYAATRRREILLRDAWGAHTKEEFAELCASFGNRCLACGEVKPLTEDHIVPLSMFALDLISNIQPLCQPCNSAKGAGIINYRPDQYFGGLKVELLPAGGWRLV